MAAWSDAATGPDGFWRRTGVGRHFRTASATTSLVATAIRAVLADRPQIRAVVEIGAGDGLLVQALHDQDPSLRLTAVDLRPAPPGLSAGIRWITGHYDVGAGRWREAAGAVPATTTEPTLVICAEWLDDLPCPVTVRRDGRWHELLVDDRGDEQLGPPVGADDEAWLRRWWPVPDEDAFPAPRAEVGRPRDRAWAQVVAALAPHGGAALMIDYGHLYAHRPAHGTLTGYRDGRRQRPRPTPAINLTAHVAVDAVADAGERAGARTGFVLDQRTAVTRLAPPAPPTPAGGVLGALQRRSERGALTSAFGDHWWLLQTVPAPSR